MNNFFQAEYHWITALLGFEDRFEDRFERGKNPIISKANKKKIINSCYCSLTNLLWAYTSPFLRYKSSRNSTLKLSPFVTSPFPWLSHLLWWVWLHILPSVSGFIVTNVSVDHMYYKFSKLSIIIHVVVSSCWDLSVVSVFSAPRGQVSTDQAECSSDGHWEEFDSGPSSCGYRGGRSLFTTHINVGSALSAVNQSPF